MLSLEMPTRLRLAKRSLADDLISNESPDLQNTSTKHVVVVMDGLKKFTTEPLEWALENIIDAGCVVTLLGVMPWLNLPLSSKTWSDIWAVDLEALSMLKPEWKNDVKYQKLQAVINLCKKYGVVPQKKVAMGHPLRLVVVEKVTSLHATWVVFDRHHRKKRGFYAERIPCTMVMMNHHREVDMIKGRPMIDNGENTPGESPADLVPTPKVMISEPLKKILMERAYVNFERDHQHEVLRVIDQGSMIAKH